MQFYLFRALAYLEASIFGGYYLYKIYRDYQTIGMNSWRGYLFLVIGGVFGIVIIGLLFAIVHVVFSKSPNSPFLTRK